VCSLCSKSGHNSRTCPSYEYVDAETTKTASGRKCGTCGKVGTGHNARTCPAEPVARLEPATTLAPARRRRRFPRRFLPRKLPRRIPAVASVEPVARLEPATTLAPVPRDNRS
jgi:hypothetical protein